MKMEILTIRAVSFCEEIIMGGHFSQIWWISLMIQFHIFIEILNLTFADRFKAQLFTFF